jgi:hypothetical protein
MEPRARLTNEERQALVDDYPFVMEDTYIHIGPGYLPAIRAALDDLELYGVPGDFKVEKIKRVWYRATIIHNDPYNYGINHTIGKHTKTLTRICMACGLQDWDSHNALGATLCPDCQALGIHYS